MTCDFHLVLNEESNRYFKNKKRGIYTNPRKIGDPANALATQFGIVYNFYAFVGNTQRNV